MKKSDRMLISVKVKANSKKESVVEEGDKLIVSVAKQPIEGKANERMIELLSEFFSISKSSIKVLRGKSSKNKIVQIERSKS